MKNTIVSKALLGVLALSGLLVGCSRERMPVENPTYNAETGEVTTQFVLNITGAPQTRMSAQTVQLAQNFRGIENARLFTFKTGQTGYRMC